MGCAQGQICDQGACVPDTNPVSECGGMAMCGANQLCVNGLCKYTCSSDQDCKLIDTRIGYCGIDKVCRTAAEAHPACTTSAMCMGKTCISNMCQ